MLEKVAYFGLDKGNVIEEKGRGLYKAEYVQLKANFCYISVLSSCMLSKIIVNYFIVLVVGFFSKISMCPQLGAYQPTA